MAQWNLTEPVSGISVDLFPVAADLRVVEDQVTAVHYGLRGTSPWVTDSARRAATFDIPVCYFRSLTELNRLRNLRNLSRRMILTDRFGRTYPVRFNGGVTQLIEDNATADTVIKVQFKLVGVV